MKFRTRAATAVGGAAVVGMTAFAVGAAAPAGAQQAKPAVQAASVTPHHGTAAQGCWDDCWGWGGDHWGGGWDEGWYSSWHSWGYGW
ncbi:hypothetical protein GCM10023191_080770 [Actinoallomurus oryzae]|jgi:hypothetical protein|uniref:Uncharacterized protein n=1 Tax=Actinoallomurus oryzae TaxID=502180 RepID=A0ABP8QYV7_9ACTN